MTSEGTKYLAIAKNEKAVMGINEANDLRLRAVNVTSGPEKGQAKSSPTSAAPWSAKRSTTAPGELTGRASSVIVGTIKNGNGIVAQRRRRRRPRSEPILSAASAPRGCQSMSTGTIERPRTPGPAPAWGATGA